MLDMERVNSFAADLVFGGQQFWAVLQLVARGKKTQCFQLAYNRQLAVLCCKKDPASQSHNPPFVRSL